MSPLPWTEKHRPSTLDEVQGNPAVVKTIRKWADSWESTEPGTQPDKPGLVLAGEPGVGKTSAALALADERGWTVVEMNASDQRNKDVIERIAGRGAMYESFSATGEFLSSKEGKRKLLILDEADNLFGNADRGGARAIVEALKHARQPVVLTANDDYQLFRKAGALKRLCEVVKFRKPQQASVANVLALVAEKEELRVDRAAIELIAGRADGDIRAAVADLESLAASGQAISVELVEELGYRDARSQTWDTIRTVFTTRDVDEARRAGRELDETPDFLLLWLEENAFRAYPSPEEWDRAYDRLSRADVFLGRAFRSRHFRLWAYASDIMTAGVARAKNDRTSGSARYSFPSWLRKMSASKAARQKRDAVAVKVGAPLHVGTRTAREDMMPLLGFLLEKDKEAGPRLAEALDLEPADAALLMNTKETTKKVKRLFEDREPDVIKERLSDAEVAALEAGGDAGDGDGEDGSDPDAAPADESAGSDDEQGGDPGNQKSLFEF